MAGRRRLLKILRLPPVEETDIQEKIKHRRHTHNTSFTHICSLNVPGRPKTRWGGAAHTHTHTNTHTETCTTKLADQHGECTNQPQFFQRQLRQSTLSGLSLCRRANPKSGRKKGRVRWLLPIWSRLDNTRYCVVSGLGKLTISGLSV